MRKLTIAVEARIEAGVQGGVEQVIRSLAAALARRDDTALQYVYVTGADSSWLAPHVGTAADVVELRPRGRRGAVMRTARALAPYAPVALQRRAVAVPADPIPNLRVDAIHFGSQNGWRSSRPFLYSPHDLLHLHRPRDLDRFGLTARTVRYAWLSRNAAFVVALTRAGQRDIIDAYDIPVERVPVIPHAPVVTPSLLSDIMTGAATLPVREFILFPAKPWPHKNHERLFEALARCRRDGVPVQLVLSGLHTGLPRDLARLSRRLGIADAVHVLGHVDERVVAELYANARGLIFPSLFEGYGLPIVEAASFALPIACSDIPALRDVAPAEARLFDPTNIDDIAAALAAVWTRSVPAPSRPTRTWDDVAAAYARLHRKLVGLRG